MDKKRYIRMIVAEIVFITCAGAFVAGMFGVGICYCIGHRCREKYEEEDNDWSYEPGEYYHSVPGC